MSEQPQGPGSEGVDPNAGGASTPPPGGEGAVPPPGEAGGGAPPDKDARMMALLAHLLGIPTSIIVPLIIWAIKKDENEFIADQSKEALNFQLTILIGYVISWALMFVFIGCITWLVLVIVSVVFGIIAAIKSNEGVRYRYPIALRLVK